MKVIDISKDVMTCPVFEGDPSPELARIKTLDDGFDYNLGKISMFKKHKNIRIKTNVAVKIAV